MSHSTPPRLRQLAITDFIGPSAVPSQEVYIAPNPHNAPKKKTRHAPNAVPVVPVVRPPYMKPKELVRTLFPLVHMRQINPCTFISDGRYKSNPALLRCCRPHCHPRSHPWAQAFKGHSRSDSSSSHLSRVPIFWSAYLIVVVPLSMLFGNAPFL